MVSKYRNVKVTIDGIVFDSKREAARYNDLKLLLRGGVISGLELQKVFRIEINGKLICKYIADFCYVEDGKSVIEDVKSAITRKHPVYRIKCKLMEAVYGVKIREV